MYSKLEGAFISKFKAAVPPLYYEQRDQFARSLPLLALFSVVFTALLGGWLGALFSVVRSLAIAPTMIVGLVLSAFFWLELFPPILWAASYIPLRDRRLLGWRLFVLGTVLSLLGALLRFNLITLLFSGAILYFTLQVYDEFYRR